LNRLSIITLILCSFLSTAKEYDRLFLPQRSFTSSAMKGLGDAGIAFPLDISSGMVNPALVYSYRRSVQEDHGSAFLSYGRDSTFNHHILPLGASYSTSEGALGFFYRLLMNKGELWQQEFILNISGQISPNSENQGPVDFGLNLRFENMKWGDRPLGDLPEKVLFRDSSGNWSGDSISKWSTDNGEGLVRDRRLLLDIGFFQENVWPNIDFGLTMRNLLGYVWSSENPDTSFSDRKITIEEGEDTALVRTYFYQDKTGKTRGWTKGKYRGLALGMVYHLDLGGNLRLSFPLDFEFIGLFDKKIKNRAVFRGGIQGRISQNFYLRVGYSRAPEFLLTGINGFKNINVFTGGGGVYIAPLKLDFYISEESFGTTLDFDF